VVDKKKTTQNETKTTMYLYIYTPRSRKRKKVLNVRREKKRVLYILEIVQPFMEGDLTKIFNFFTFDEIGSCHATQAGLQLTEYYCLSLPSARIVGVGHPSHRTVCRRERCQLVSVQSWQTRKTEHRSLEAWEPGPCELKF
jgi:hypothetical protein